MPQRDRRVGGAVPAARGRRARTVRGRRRVLRGDRPRGAACAPARTSIVVGGGNSAGPGRDLPRAAGQPGDDLHPGRRPREEHVALPHRADRRRRRGSRCSPRPRCVPSRASSTSSRSRSSTRRRASGAPVECAGLFCFIGADPATEWLGELVALDARGFVLTDRSLPADRAGDGHVPRARNRCRSRRRCPACSRSATCATVRSSGSRPRSARDRARCGRCTSTSRPQV